MLEKVRNTLKMLHFQLELVLLSPRRSVSYMSFNSRVYTQVKSSFEFFIIFSTMCNCFNILIRNPIVYYIFLLNDFNKAFCKSTLKCVTTPLLITDLNTISVFDGSLNVRIKMVNSKLKSIW